MNPLRLPLVFGLFLLCSASVQAQDNEAPQQSTPTQEPDPRLLQRPSPADLSAKQNATPQQIELTVPRDTPIRIALSRRVRINHEGTPVEGQVTDTVYAFDQPVIPAGSQVRGHVARIAPISKMRRTMAIADADFSPPHQYTVTFDTVILRDGRHLPVVTTASPGTANVVHLMSDPARVAKKNAAAQAADSAKQQVTNTYHQAMSEIKSPGRMHRIKQFLLAQLPYRRQYLEPGTRFDADLEAPLDFGSVTRVPGQLRSVGAEPAPDTTIHARLADDVNSATAGRGMPIEAVITQPVFSADHQLLLPANSRIFGEVTHAKPAGKLHHNGELRVVFERIATPEGQMQAMHGSLEGVEVDRAASMKLDSEGGAHATDGKSRYISTGLAVVVAAAAAHPESDSGASDGLADPGVRAAAGGSGFKLVGAVLSLASHSKVFSSTLGFYGAATSIYSHFLSHGKDVVLPKDTPIEITFGPPSHGASPTVP
jgi:type IV secretory pathway VirB10-like protein